MFILFVMIFCSLFLVGYRQPPELVLVPGRISQIYYLVLMCRKTPFNQNKKSSNIAYMHFDASHIIYAVILVLFQYKPDISCVTPAQFIADGGYVTQTLASGNWSVRMHAMSLAGDGPWTENQYFYVARFGMKPLFNIYHIDFK